MKMTAALLTVLFALNSSAFAQTQTNSDACDVLKRQLTDLQSIQDRFDTVNSQMRMIKIGIGAGWTVGAVTGLRLIGNELKGIGSIWQTSGPSAKVRTIGLIVLAVDALATTGAYLTKAELNHKLDLIVAETSESSKSVDAKVSKIERQIKAQGCN